ncbi:hypothetical protein ACLOJK_037536, partial [Asimina triloba]
MSTVLAFRFVPRGGFALSNHRSFDPAISHCFIHVPASMARRTYHHVDYSPTTITFADKKNWPTLSAAATAPPSSRRAISVIPTASPEPRRRHKNAFTPVAAFTAPRPSHKVTPTTMVVTPTSGVRPPCKVVVSSAPIALPAPRRRHKSASTLVTAAIALRPYHKDTISTVPAASPAPRHRRKSTFAPVAASPTPHPSRKASSAAIIATATTAS